ncbi:hypothetical protein I7I53_08856 [Histoplasma capsulatum var. duboisii H88]|uniref:Uncharacterized protein n=1 Tax=Ajellomyces capsulatus (strain H88) TaxID=544711 RepID=A0A8A1L4A1_AJEC8|nr:hypothetical protein I7I53_08856 [Histoplasma capsulatum var. duboisii H88]
MEKPSTSRLRNRRGWAHALYMIRISVYGLDQRLWRIDQMPRDSTRPLMHSAFCRPKIRDA